MHLRIKLAVTVWAAVVASIVLSYFFWRIGYFSLHAVWAVLSLLSISVPMIGLIWCAIRGPFRLQAIGWLLIAATPLVWIATYFTHLSVSARTRATLVINTPMCVAAIAASSAFDLQARWRYPRWTRGQHAVLMDAGQTPNPVKLVSEMDDHIKAMAKLLGQPAPDCELPWVRGSLFGHNKRAIVLWALCGQENNPAEITHLDYHEIAHTLITALVSSDHEPPFVLIEGWAESQSSDRDFQISDLAEKYKDGRAYSLQELVNPFWYGKGDGPVYWQGGPLVHYLMEHYSPEKFLELYTGVRRNTFQKDCQRILGDSWETVEKQFWTWIESEAHAIAQADPQKSFKIDFAPSVKQEDWQALVEGCQQAHKKKKQLPQNLAFLIELNRTITDENTNLDKQPFSFELHAVFAKNNFWIFENYSHNKDRFLVMNEEHCAHLKRDQEGNLDGWVKGPYKFQDVRYEAQNLMRLFLNVIDPITLLPLPNGTQSGLFTITELSRPQEGSTDPWSISLTQQQDGVEFVPNFQLDIDPAQEWSITRFASNKSDSRNSLVEYQYQRINDYPIPKTSASRYTNGNNEVIAQASCRALTQQEQSELRKQVEQAVESLPTPPQQNFQRLLIAISILCPLVGLLCLKLAKPPTPTPGTTQ